MNDILKKHSWAIHTEHVFALKTMTHGTILSSDRTAMTVKKKKPGFWDIKIWRVIFAFIRTGPYSVISATSFLKGLENFWYKYLYFREIFSGFLNWFLKDIF